MKAKPLVDKLADYWSSLDPEAYRSLDHGDVPQWLEVIDVLSAPCDASFDVENGVPSFSVESPSQNLEALLKKLHPWRKGPLQIGDVFIDSEWDARQKWDVVSAAVGSLEGLDVLDIGCSNGYYLWRMLQAGAKRVLGVEPYPPNVMQFELCKKLAGAPDAVKMLPSFFEKMPQNMRAFDAVFSMGVLYHRKSPIDHLMQIRHQLKPGGKIILETLVVDGDEETCLIPQDRYQQMNNVWFLPSASHLVRWMERCKYRSIEVQDIRPTRITEQRATEWMSFHSLEQFLDPQDSTKTVEGYQAPTRCLITAEAP